MDSSPLTWVVRISFFTAPTWRTWNRPLKRARGSNMRSDLVRKAPRPEKSPQFPANDEGYTQSDSKIGRWQCRRFRFAAGVAVGAADTCRRALNRSFVRGEQGRCKHRLESLSRLLPRSEPTAWLASALEVKRDAARELAETASCKDEDAGEASDRFLNDEVYK